MNKESKRYFKIADITNISEDDALQFALPQLRNEEYADIYENIPLSSYYYDALILAIDKKYENLIRQINRFRTQIHYCWSFVDFDNNPYNFQELQCKIYQCSKELKAIIRNNSNNVFTGKSSESVERFFKEINLEKYTSWLDNLDNYIGPNLKRNLLNKIKNIRCVAIAIPINLEYQGSEDLPSYFSLSGSGNDYISNHPSVIWQYCLQSEYNAVKNLLRYIYGYDFVEAHLTDFTKRYTYRWSKRNQCQKFSGKVLKNPVSFISDYLSTLTYRKNKINCLRRYYSCCEKKIVSAMGFTNRDYVKLLIGVHINNYLSQYMFRVALEPCVMCRPALIGCNNIFFNNANHKIVNSNLDPYEPLILQ